MTALRRAVQFKVKPNAFFVQQQDLVRRILAWGEAAQTSILARISAIVATVIKEQTVIKRVSMKPEHGNFGQLYQKACYMNPVFERFRWWILDDALSSTWSYEYFLVNLNSWWSLGLWSIVNVV